MQVVQPLEHCWVKKGKPIAFFGENLNDAKKKYSVYNEEVYAIVQAFDRMETLLSIEEIWVVC